MTRFKTLAATALLSLATTLGTAQAQTFPNKPITLIVPYAAGGLTDQLAREVGQHMATVLKQPVVVDNRPGGGAQVAMNALKQAPADGHAVFFGDVPSLATNVGLFSKLSYDPRKDLQPVAQLIVSPALVVVPMNSPYKTFADLVNAAKALPKGLSYASQGVGTGGHLFGTLLSKHIGAGMTHVAYRGSAPGLSDVVAGQVDFMYDPSPPRAPSCAASACAPWPSAPTSARRCCRRCPRSRNWATTRSSPSGRGSSFPRGRPSP